MSYDVEIIRDKLREMLMEDIGFGDITTSALIANHVTAKAYIIADEAGIISGLEEANLFLKELGVEVKQLLKDGDKVTPRSVIMELQGPAKSILMGERVILNLLMRMSGIATMTSKAVENAKAVNPRIIVAGTRKTMPLLRWFDKKAIKIGSGDTHRWRLDDCVLIKDNHLALVGDVKQAVRRAIKAVSFSKKIEIEVQNPEDAVIAARAGADIVMLDNMSLKNISGTIKLLRDEGLRDKILIEASGGITLENAAEYAKTGVDIISMGCLTHSVKALNLKLKILEP